MRDIGGLWQGLTTEGKWPLPPRSHSRANTLLATASLPSFTERFRPSARIVHWVPGEPRERRRGRRAVRLSGAAPRVEPGFAYGRNVLLRRTMEHKPHSLRRHALPRSHKAIVQELPWSRVPADGAKQQSAQPGWPTTNLVHSLHGTRGMRTRGTRRGRRRTDSPRPPAPASRSRSRAARCRCCAAGPPAHPEDPVTRRAAAAGRPRLRARA